MIRFDCSVKPFFISAMQLKEAIQQTSGFGNLQLLANQVVEGFISGIHKSPFRGFSAEFAEHKSFNPGDSTRYIDWKHYAKTDRLYVKTFEEETNLRCHLIIDNSASMHYPMLKTQTLQNYNKIGFSVLAAASLMNLLKRQRDAVGLSIYSDNYSYYSPEKGSDRHHRMLLQQLENLLENQQSSSTDTFTFLHQIAEKIKRRSLVFLFTDMFQAATNPELLFDALKHLKHNKHQVVLFHVIDKTTELEFDFDNTPKRFVDVETGQKIDLFADNIKEIYNHKMQQFFDALKLQCAKYQISYVQSDIHNSLELILSTYLNTRGRFI